MIVRHGVNLAEASLAGKRLVCRIRPNEASASGHLPAS